MVETEQDEDAFVIISNISKEICKDSRELYDLAATQTQCGEEGTTVLIM